MWNTGEPEYKKEVNELGANSKPVIIIIIRRKVKVIFFIVLIFAIVL